MYMYFKYLLNQQNTTIDINKLCHVKLSEKVYLKGCESKKIRIQKVTFQARKDLLCRKLGPLTRKCTLMAFRLQAVCQQFQQLGHPFAGNMSLFEQLHYPVIGYITPFERMLFLSQEKISQTKLAVTKIS